MVVVVIESLAKAFEGASAASVLYLDPGTGSFLIQVAAAALLGGLAAVRSVRGKIGSSFRVIFGGREPEDEARDDR